MKTLTFVIAILFSTVSLANNYSVRNKGTDITYERNTHSLIVSKSQEVTVTDKDGKQSTFNRGVATMIPLDREPQYQQNNR